jgi:hypothetical protein
MVRHSKNNTASASFTKAEYGMLSDRYGSKRMKLGSESFKQFDHCSLCLNQVESPVTCNQGHLFCKVCIYTSLLDQKKEIAHVKATLLSLEKDHQLQRERARADAMERVQKDFERVQSGGGRDSVSKNNGEQQNEHLHVSGMMANTMHLHSEARLSFTLQIYGKLIGRSASSNRGPNRADYPASHGSIG